MSEVNPTAEELVRNVTFTLQRAAVVTVPIDPTLSIEGEAADAKAVGDAIADIDAAKSVNSQTPDTNGNVTLLASHIPMSSDVGAQTVAQAITAAQSVTGSTIMRTSETTETVEQGMQSIESAISTGCTNEEIDGLFEEDEA